MVKSLAYLGASTPAVDEWRTFGPEILGMEVRDDENGDGVLVRMDDTHHRIALHRGERNSLQYLGWDVGGEAELEQHLEALQRAGVDARWGTPEECQQRKVLGMVVATGPAGLRQELVYGQYFVPRSFKPGRPISGFITGDQGLGHAVLAVPDLKEAHGFYSGLLGMRKSDEIYTFIDIVFYHCNPRHHTLAMTEVPGIRGLHHVMVQVGSIDDVGIAYDMCLERGLPISMTLGRHVNDEMVSFYVRSPSGFDIEYGYGAIEVDSDWSVKQFDRSSIWGHKMNDQLPPGAFEPVPA